MTKDEQLALVLCSVVEEIESIGYDVFASRKDEDTVLVEIVNDRNVD